MATVAEPRRHTSPNVWATPFSSRRQRVRASTTAEPKQAGLSSLAPITEEDNKQSASARQSHWSKHFSWVPGWSFAGEARQSNAGSDDATSSSPGEDNLRRTSTISRLSRRISSLPESWIFRTDPSHETNFPPNVSFPEDDGRKSCLSVFGTMDSLDGTSMRLQLPRRILQANLSEQKEYKAMLEYIGPKLKNGDMLVRPFLERYRRDPNMAMIVRGAIQDCVFKCYVVGLFPMKVFGHELPETYQLDVQLY